MSASGDKFACTSCGATFVTPWPNCPICNAPMAAEGGGGGSSAPAASASSPAGGPARLNLNFNFGGPGAPDASHEPQLFASAPASPSSAPYQPQGATGTSRLDEIFQSSPDAPPPKFSSFTFGGTPKADAASGAPAGNAPAGGTTAPAAAAGGPTAAPQTGAAPKFSSPPSFGGGAGLGSAGLGNAGLGGAASGGAGQGGAGQGNAGLGATGGASAPAAKASSPLGDPFKGPLTPSGKKGEFKPINFAGPSTADPSPSTTGAEASKSKTTTFEPIKPLSPRPAPAAPKPPPADDALARSLALLDSLESSKVSAVLPSAAYLATRPTSTPKTPPSTPVQASAPGGLEGDSQLESAAAAEPHPTADPTGGLKPQRPPLRPIGGASSRPGSDHALSSMNRIWPPKEGDVDAAAADPHADSLPSEEDSLQQQYEEEQKKSGIVAILGILAALVVFLAFTASALVFGISNLAGGRTVVPSPSDGAATVGGSPAESDGPAKTAAAETAAAVASSAGATTSSPTADTASTAPPATSAAASTADRTVAASTASVGGGTRPPVASTGVANVVPTRSTSTSPRQAVWEALESNVPEVASAASQRIVSEQGKGAVPKLVEMLKASNRSGRTWAAKTLAQFGPDAGDAAEMLAKNLPRGGDETQASIEALTAIGPPSLPLMLKALRDPDPVRPVETQLAALEVIQKVGPQGTLLVAPAVLPFLDSTNPDLRETSKETLKRLGAGSLPVSVDAWREGQAPLRKSLCEVWADYGPAAQPVCPLLGEVLKSGDDQLFRHAALTLYKIGPAALPTLFDVLENAKSRKAREEASKAVGWIGEPGVKPALDQLDVWIKSGKSAYDDPVGYLLSSLGRMGAAGKAALPKLAEWSRHPNGNISFYARDSLDKIQRAKP